MTSPKDKLKAMRKELRKDKELFDSLADEFEDVGGDRLLGPETELEYRRMIKDLKDANDKEGVKRDGN